MPLYEGKVNAPDFPAGLDWLNVSEPLSMQKLRGKMVLLDFWTYCCINCMHVIPDLKKLEAKYPDQLVVIGVHSAKFPAEKDTHNILQAILRHEIEHPVVNDHSMAVWGAYTVRAWPTVVLIDPAGKVVGAHTGEGVLRALEPVLEKMAAEFESRGLMDRRPLAIDPFADHMPRSLLSFPGKLLADERSGSLFIADSNHNRIIITTLDGDVLNVIDGFNHPQGMCLVGGFLYVADTENHAIQRIEIATCRVEMIAEGLNSPWDLVAVGDAIYIAMAGLHQIWRLDIRTGAAAPFAGSGAEDLVDGARSSAALAQPSGITSDGTRLYFADSETSSIRFTTIESGGVVGTIAGRGLFEFGDRDGVGDEVRLQHPLGIAYHQGDLFVADTFNNKIKRVTPATRKVATFADGFAEPGGLSVARGNLYVADTNNHVIRVIDLQNPAVSTLMLKGLEKLKPPTTEWTWAGKAIHFEPALIRPGEVKIVVAPRFPEGMVLNPDAPNRLLIRSKSTGLVFDGNRSAILVNKPDGFPVELTATLKEPDEITVLAEVYYCHTGDQGLCFYAEILATIALAASPDFASTSVTLVLEVV